MEDGLLIVFSTELPWAPGQGRVRTPWHNPAPDPAQLTCGGAVGSSIGTDGGGAEASASVGVWGERG